MITPTSVGAGFILLVEQAKPFLMFLLEGTEVRSIIESTKAIHIPLVIGRSIRKTTHGLSLCHS
ncbi:MAG: hypothetical protein ABSD38_38480 [Syntrophorhabdales bacterium]